MIKKENWPPIKQGVFYQLNLSKNSGPFLSKDIMNNNPISNNLLTCKEKIHQFKKMSQTLSTVQSMPKLQTYNESKTENFTAVIKFCDVLVTSLRINCRNADIFRQSWTWRRKNIDRKQKNSMKRYRQSTTVYFSLRCLSLKI